LFLAPSFGIFGVGIGVIIGALLHLAIQIPSAIGCGFRYLPLFNIKHPALKEVVSLMIPRSFAVGAQQINLIVITGIASTLGTGSIAIFNFANNLYYAPVGIFGISFALASFPRLSKSWAEEKREEFLDTFSSVFRQILFLIIPSSILIFLLRAQLVRIILGSLGPGRFGWNDTRLTAACLGIFSISIFASALIPFICRAFFSFKDTKTPTFIAVGGVVLNILLSVVFVKVLRMGGTFYNFVSGVLDLEGIENISVTGLPLAFSIAVIFQFVLLLYFLHKRIGEIRAKEILSSLRKIIFASIVAGFVVLVVLRAVAKVVDMHTFLGVFSQASLGGIAGVSVYLILSLLFKSSELRIIKSAVLKQFSMER